MSFIDRAGKVADLALRGTAGYLESASKSVSRNKKYSEEQRQAILEYSDKMRNIKENGFSALSSSDDYYEDNYYEVDSGEDDYYEDNSGGDNYYVDNNNDNKESSDHDANINLPQKKKVDKDKSTSKGDANSLENLTYAERKHAEREKNRRILESIKAKKEFVMKINTIQYAEKKSGKGFILSGRIKKGGIYQGERMYITISHGNKMQSQHRLISVLSYSNHKKYNYAKKGQYVKLFIEEDMSFNMTMADSVISVVYNLDVCN